MLGKANWPETQARWAAYWRRENTGRPLMCVVAREPATEAAFQRARAEGRRLFSVLCEGADATLPRDLEPLDPADQYRTAARLDARYRHFLATHRFLAESFPNIDPNFGPGSLPAYLGSDIVFGPDTVWFDRCVDDWATWPPLRFDPANPWWAEHYRLVADLVTLAGGDYLVPLPDLGENIDVLAALRGPTGLLLDTMDCPDEVDRRVAEVTDVYFEFYDRFYDLVQAADGSSAYTVFQVWGPGRVSRLGCDLSAMLGPDHFRALVLDSVRTIAGRLDQVLYHLDGAEAIRHLDALMEIDEIDVLQWTPGNHGPDGTAEQWDIVYDKARAAGKAIWVKVHNGGVDDWIAHTDRLIARYGSRGTFLHFPEMSLAEAEKLLDHAERRWSDVEGAV
ncbi:MAG: hypothetical protein LBR33_04105 [Propionibacteriaceae bacterium]|jgi:5-methyltetrahydrofolate--homocysteine methyltransferase|nr:hypothetical protein [Propionibacteriaceae bacterium]